MDSTFTEAGSYSEHLRFECNRCQYAGHVFDCTVLRFYLRFKFHRFAYRTHGFVLTA